jgi:hypothetical protein
MGVFSLPNRGNWPTGLSKQHSEQTAEKRVVVDIRTCCSLVNGASRSSRIEYFGGIVPGYAAILRSEEFSMITLSAFWSGVLGACGGPPSMHSDGRRGLVPHASQAAQSASLALALAGSALRIGTRGVDARLHRIQAGRE